MTVQPCPPSTPVVTGIVAFDLAEFTGVYPEFTGITQGQGSGAFARASLLLSNCCKSPVSDANIRQTLLYMLTAHITYLFTPCTANSNDPPQAVGRVANASQGSVSAGLEMPSNPEAAWYMQTKYGAEFWNATAWARSMRSIPAPHRCGGLPFEGFGSGLGPVGTGFGGFNGGSS